MSYINLYYITLRYILFVVENSGILCRCGWYWWCWECNCGDADSLWYWQGQINVLTDNAWILFLHWWMSYYVSVINIILKTEVREVRVGESTDPLKFEIGVKKLIPRLFRTGDFWPWPLVEKWFPRACLKKYILYICILWHVSEKLVI